MFENVSYIHRKVEDVSRKVERGVSDAMKAAVDSERDDQMNPFSHSDTGFWFPEFIFYFLFFLVFW